jgi:HEAT repeat protein
VRYRVFVLLALMGAGCKRKPAGPILPRVVSIDIADRSRESVLDGQAIAGRAAGALRESNLFEVLEPGVERELINGQQVWRCRIEVGAATDRGGTDAVVKAMADVECGPTGASGSDLLSARALADQPVKGGGSTEERMRALAGRLVSDTVGLVVRQYRLRIGTTGELLAALKDVDADVRRQAVRAAAWRRERATLPALVALLDDPQDDLRDMALGALTDIADPAAIKPITARVKFSDTDQLRKVIDPVASIGGDEAHAFLEFVGSGSEDPEIRKMAKEALERMDRRARTAAQMRQGSSERARE